MEVGTYVINQAEITIYNIEITFKKTAVVTMMHPDTMEEDETLIERTARNKNNVKKQISNYQPNKGKKENTTITM